MAEHCQISCCLVDYSLGPLILCWESYTHLAVCVGLKVHGAADTPLPSESVQLHVTVRHRCFPAATYMHLKPEPSFTTLPTPPIDPWLYVKVHQPVYILPPILIPQPEGDDLFNCEIAPFTTSLPGTVPAAGKGRG